MISYLLKLDSGEVITLSPIKDIALKQLDEILVTDARTEFRVRNDLTNRLSEIVPQYLYSSKQTFVDKIANIMESRLSDITKRQIFIKLVLASIKKNTLIINSLLTQSKELPVSEQETLAEVLNNLCNIQNTLNTLINPINYE